MGFIFLHLLLLLIHTHHEIAREWTRHGMAFLPPQRARSHGYRLPKKHPAASTHSSSNPNFFFNGFSPKIPLDGVDLWFRDFSVDYFIYIYILYIYIRETLLYFQKKRKVDDTLAYFILFFSRNNQLFLFSWRWWQFGLTLKVSFSFWIIIKIFKTIKTHSYKMRANQQSLTFYEAPKSFFRTNSLMI